MQQESEKYLRTEKYQTFSLILAYNYSFQINDIHKLLERTNTLGFQNNGSFRTL